MAADRGDLNRHPEVRTTDKFHHVVDASIARDGQDGFDPVLLPTVDAFIGAQRDGAFELGGAAGDDYAGAMEFGDLNAEQRDTTGALDQHRLAGTYVTALGQCEPCG